jgi:drug/metabolite transporter (DMT)-like permease
VAILLALISSTVWGTSDFIGGMISRRTPAHVVVAISQATGLAAVTLVVVFTGGFGHHADWVGPAVIAGAGLAAGLVMFYAALATGAMGIVSPIAALGVLVPVTVGLAQGDTLNATTSIGIVLALGGVITASAPEFRVQAHARSIVLAGASAVCFGIVLLFLAQGAQADPVMSLWGMRATSVIGVTIAILISPRRRAASVAIRRQDVPLVMLAGIGDSAANLLFQLASLRGYLSVVSVLASLYPAVTAMLAWAVLHQRLQRTQLVGVIAILGGVALVSLG